MRTGGEEEEKKGEKNDYLNSSCIQLFTKIRGEDRKSSLRVRKFLPAKKLIYILDVKKE
jgi:hypothetical protein